MRVRRWFNTHHGMTFQAYQRARRLGDTPGRSRDRSLVVMTRLLTPLGPMVAGASDEGVCLLEFAERRMLETQLRRLQRHLSCVMAPGSNEHIERLDRQLIAYFDGSLREFSVPTVTPARTSSDRSGPS